MSREEEVDHTMLEAFYFAYKDGKPYPATIGDAALKKININVDEFMASQRRLMQNGLLNGTKQSTTAGTSYFPNEISTKGIDVYESDIDPLFRGIDVLDLGFSGKKYLFLKWIKKNWKWYYMATVPIIGIILSVLLT